MQDALRRLLEQKGFDDITVQDITEAATLNRATFYAHYPDKFALLEELIRASFLQLLGQRNVSFDGTCSSAFKAIILALCDYLLEVQRSHSSGSAAVRALRGGHGNRPDPPYAAGRVP